MKFDSISVIAETMPFYGHLDDVYRLLRRVNWRTRIIWDTIHAEMSKNVERRDAFVSTARKEDLVDRLLNNKLITTLFTSKSIEIDSLVKYQWFIELIEEIEEPQMLDLSVEFSLTENAETSTALFDYNNYMKDRNLRLLEIYNKAIEAIIKKNISLKIVKSFVFLNELPLVESAEYIDAIIIYCSGNTNIDMLIETFKELMKSTKIRFNKVKLVRRTMETKFLTKIVNFLTNQNVNVQIISISSIPDLPALVKNDSNNNCHLLSFKFTYNYEYVLWDRKRQGIRMLLSKQYILPYLDSDYGLEISKWRADIVKYIKDKPTKKLIVLYNDWLWLDFDFNAIRTSKHNIKINQIIEFRTSRFIFFPKQLSVGYYRKTIYNEHIFSHHGDLLISQELTAKLVYSKVNKFIQLSILGSILNHSDVETLSEFMISIKYIRSITLSIYDQNSVMFILGLFDYILTLKSVCITLHSTIDEEFLFQVLDFILINKENKKIVKLYYYDSSDIKMMKEIS